MKYILTADEIRRAEALTLESGISVDELMLKAGEAVADEVDKLFEGADVLVICGGGSNGGDGYAAAKVLKERDHNVTCLKLTERMTEECRKRFEEFDGEVVTRYEVSVSYDVIIDAMTGTGLKGVLKEPYSGAASYINSTDSFKISIDLPSGLATDTGIVGGVCVAADMTVTLTCYKTGLFLNDGMDYTGKVVLKDIGVKLPEENDYAFRFDNQDVKELFPKRKRNVNKGDFGRCSLIAGSYEYAGAAEISSSALAALKMGAGYSNLCIPMSLYSHFGGKTPECTITLLKDKTGELEFDRLMLKRIASVSQSIAIGMGVKTGEPLYKTIEFLLKNFKGNLLIDADGLNTLKEFGSDILKTKKCKVLITPHIKEFARLYCVDVSAVEKNGIEFAKRFAVENDITVLLKSASSIITDGKRVAINTRGDSAMAKSGTGDILSGVIGGLLARGIDMFDAAVAGAYICGMAGERAAENSNEYTVSALDIVDEIAAAVKVICE